MNKHLIIIIKEYIKYDRVYESELKKHTECLHIYIDYENYICSICINIKEI